MKKYCLYFDKNYKCVSFIVYYKGLTLTVSAQNLNIKAEFVAHTFSTR